MLSYYSDVSLFTLRERYIFILFWQNIVFNLTSGREFNSGLLAKLPMHPPEREHFSGTIM